MNILGDFLSIGPSGLYCKYGDFFLDPTHASNRAVISHAHGDHAVSGNGLVWCTPASAAIMKYRYGQRGGASLIVFPYGHWFDIGNVRLQFLSAGHILGSAQVLMEYKDVRYLYTGDYKLQSDDTCEPIVDVRADVLITESTFANPNIRHPDPISEIIKLNEQPYNIMLGTYSLGKAQRLNSLIQANCPGKSILLHHSILPLHRIYEQFGVTHLCYQPFDRKLVKHANEGFIYLVPPVTFNHYDRANNMLRAFASGWPELHTRNDIAIHISDHADWDDILQYVSRVQPDEIWTLHGKGEFLRRHFDGCIPVKILNR